MSALAFFLADTPCAPGWHRLQTQAELRAGGIVNPFHHRSARQQPGGQALSSSSGTYFGPCGKNFRSRRRFACLQKAFAYLHRVFVSLRKAFACLQSVFVSLQKDFANKQKVFACLQKGSACLKKAFAYLQNGFVSLRKGFADKQRVLAYLQRGSAYLHRRLAC